MRGRRVRVLFLQFLSGLARLARVGYVDTLHRQFVAVGPSSPGDGGVANCAPDSDLRSVFSFVHYRHITQLLAFRQQLFFKTLPPTLFANLDTHPPEMKTQVISTTPPAPKLPEVGQLWRLEGGPEVYFRVKDDQGERAFTLHPGVSQETHIFSVRLSSGRLGYIRRSYEHFELLQPVGGEPLKLEVVR